MPVQRFAPMSKDFATFTRFRAVFIPPMFLEGHYLNHTCYEPLWGAIEQPGLTVAAHATAGLWNPEWRMMGGNAAAQFGGEPPGA
ncbi:MAG TPA: hypothetical protein VGG57_01375 [Stellaceae bacterium]|jgi:hypothetical protein